MISAKPGFLAIAANVTIQTSSWAGSVWQFEVVSIEDVTASVAEILLAQYQEMRDLNANGADLRTPFTPISSRFTAAVAALEADKSNFSKVTALRTLIENPDNYYQLETGRYIVNNYYTHDRSGTEAAYENNQLFTQTTLTSLTALVGAGGQVGGYWSVWDITRNDDGTYRMVNEGNRYVLKPSSVQGNYDPANDYTDEGVLYYKPGDGTTTRYQVGNVPSGAVADLRFTPALSLYGHSFNGVSMTDRRGYVTISGSYATNGKENCVMFMDAAEGGKAHVTYNGDHYENNNSGDNVIKSGIMENMKEECLWGFYRLDTREGNDRELSLFYNATEGSLVGIVGGVITLDNVGTITCLSDIKNKIDTSRSGIGSMEISQEPGIRAQKYKDIINDIEALRADPVNKQYYQILKPDSENPFYLENMSAIRPSLFSRLTTYETGSTLQWCAAPKETINHATPQGEFKSVIVSGDGGAGTVYKLKNGNGKYLKSTGRSSFVDQTDDASQAAQFTMNMVIPGIYQMKQTNGNYFVISGSDEHFGLKGFNQAEISALWRFVTYNTVHVEAKIGYENTDFVAPIAEAGVTGAENVKPVFTTFSHDLNTRVAEDKYIVPYYITNIGLQDCWVNGMPEGSHQDKIFDEDVANTSYGENAVAIKRMYVTMVKAPLISDGVKNYYYMEDNEGYLLVGSETKVGGEALGITSEDVELLAYDVTGVAGYGSTIHGINMFTPNVGGDILITKQNQKNYFALQYTYDQVGVWNYQPLYGDGLGFYILAPGRKIGKNKAYIAARTVKDETISWEGYNPNGAGAHESEGDTPSQVKSFLESGDGFSICLAEQDGTITSVIDVDAQGNAQVQGIYDLQGRRVERAGKGIYIVGGRKVMFK